MFGRRERRGRTLAMLWAVLQFTLPVFASSADARVEEESRAQVAHVESTSTPSCSAVRAAECALCQLLTHHAPAPLQGEPPVIATRVPCSVDSECLAPATAALGHLPSSRAPPLA